MNTRPRDPHGRVFLRPLTESDITDSYVAWFRDPEVTRFLDARDISRNDAIEHLRRGQIGKAWLLYAICKADGRHVGNLKIGPILWRHMTSDMITVIGDRSVWGQGCAREAIRLGIDIAFSELNIRKLSASIDSLNAGSIEAYIAAGFHIETRLKDQFVDRAAAPMQLSDKIYVACFNSDFDPARISE